ncbi:hypothetical protein T265_08604 [Opisthorchis viverrini]|uniref:Uncharacterized protein n=1 Tax=Opisthorchis viverrini TaxID=6198 RepID=A0A074Z8H8_OPIVI|nr:hypothetical protein T265_08604 [Opisthorchis viverrini]KER23521.1 hypothetical protein T265_08604 [Opisthorchis viverrini]
MFRSLYSHTSGRVNVLWTIQKVVSDKDFHSCSTSSSMGARWLKWLEREFTDRKVRGSNPTSATRLPLSRLGQPDSIPALVLPSETGPYRGVTVCAPQRSIELYWRVSATLTESLIPGWSMIVENFTYLGSSINSDGSVSDEVSTKISKARITFANLRNLWRQKGISVDLKGRVYQAALRALLYGCETTSANR